MFSIVVLGQLTVCKTLLVYVRHIKFHLLVKRLLHLLATSSADMANNAFKEYKFCLKNFTESMLNSNVDVNMS